MTKQDAFNLLWEYYIIFRNRRGWDIEQGRHMYRGSDGCRCPVGVLLPDVLYNSSMEGYDVQQLWEEDDDFHQHFQLVGLQFLKDVQDAHDDGIGPKGATDFNGYMQKKLRELAEIYDLVIPDKVIPLAPVVQDQGYRPQFKQWRR